MAIVWTKDWSGADDGTILGGIDLKNIQDDLANLTDVSAIGVTVQAFDDNLDTLSSPENVNSSNLLFNGAFDTFTSSPTPDNWVVEGGGTEAQDTTNVRVGENSYSVTSDADGSASRQTVYATIDGAENSYWRSKTVTLTAQVYATSASNARIQIDDGVTTSESPYHTGTTGFEELSVTHVISSSASKLDVVLLIDGNAQEAKFDAVRLNHGESKWQFVRHSEDFLPLAPLVTPSQETFTADGTFTAPTGITQVLISLVGGGGGGGGRNNSRSGGGGGGQAFFNITYTVIPSNDYIVQVGVGGAVGLQGVPFTDGFNGEDSIFDTGGTGVTALGGKGGEKSGGTGGLGGGRNVTITGYPLDSSDATLGAGGIPGGNGGDGIQGGVGGSTAFSIASVLGTASPINTGVGGSGDDNGANTGQDGADGVVIVTF